jgi:hypothetical protein
MHAIDQTDSEQERDRTAEPERKAQNNALLSYFNDIKFFQDGQEHSTAQ